MPAQTWSPIMNARSMRIPVLVCVATVLWLSAAESRACGLLDWLFPRRAAARTTFYAPATLTAAYAPAQTCYYLPQTSYRVTYQRVPVMTYRAVTACDPCTGAAVTTYRPVLGFTHEARMIPYTTYRIAYANPSGGGVPAVGWGGAYSVGYVAPAASWPSSACAPTTTYYPPPTTCPAPTTTYYPPPESYPAPPTTYPAPATANGRPTTAYPQEPGEGLPRTFQEDPAAQDDAGAVPSGNDVPAQSDNGGDSPRGGSFDQRLPIYQLPRSQPPGSQLNSAPAAPGPIDPAGRTASLSSERAAHVHPISASQSSLPALPNSVWRASGAHAR
jgi:hypothetical protein